MASRPRARRIQAFSVEVFSQWTVAQVRSALDCHEAGKFQRSAQLADAMGRDPRIAAARDNLPQALGSRSALPFEVVEADGGDGRMKAAALRRQNELWWYSCPEDAVAPVLTDAVDMGLAVGWIAWESFAGEWVPRLQWLPPHGLSWERNGVPGTPSGDERRPAFAYRTADGRLLEVTPGDGTWFLYLPRGPRSWMFGAVRKVGLIWKKRLDALRDWTRYCEKHGLPILKVTEPFWATDDVEGDEGAEGTYAEQFYAQFDTLGSEATIGCPKGRDEGAGDWDLDWVEPESDSWETFRQLLDTTATDIDYAYLGRSETGSKGGDGELQSERVRIEGLSAYAETLSTALRDQVWKPWAEFNYGDRELAGWGRWNTRPPPDLKLRAETLKSMAEAVTALAALEVDVAPVLEEFGLSAPEGGVKTPAPPPPTKQPQPAAA